MLYRHSQTALLLLLLMVAIIFTCMGNSASAMDWRRTRSRRHVDIARARLAEAQERMKEQMNPDSPHVNRQSSSFHFSQSSCKCVNGECNCAREEGTGDSNIDSFLETYCQCENSDCNCYLKNGSNLPSQVEKFVEESCHCKNGSCQCRRDGDDGSGEGEEGSASGVGETGIKEEAMNLASLHKRRDQVGAQDSRESKISL